MPHVDGITVLDDGATPDNHASDSDESASDSDSPAVTDSDAAERAQPSRPTGNCDSVPAQHLDQQVAELQNYQDLQERREEMKQQLGVTASKLLQNPEANLPSMRSLLTLATDKDSQVNKSVMLFGTAFYLIYLWHNSWHNSWHKSAQVTARGTTDRPVHGTASP